MSLVFRIYNNKEESPLKMKKYEKLINIISMVFAPVLIFYLFEWYMRNPFEKMNVSLQILNIFFFEFLLYFLIGIFGKIKVAIRVEAVLAIVVGLADYFVIQFRSTSIMPWDIFSIGTAASVANNYKYHLNARAVIVTILLLLIIVSCRWLKLTIGKKLPVRLLFVLAGFLMLFGFILISIALLSDMMKRHRQLSGEILKNQRRALFCKESLHNPPFSREVLILRK